MRIDALEYEFTSFLSGFFENFSKMSHSYDKH